jgi:hypothetical protein
MKRNMKYVYKYNYIYEYICQLVNGAERREAMSEICWYGRKEIWSPDEKVKFWSTGGNNFREILAAMSQKIFLYIR